MDSTRTTEMEESHPRTMVKCAWRCSLVKPMPSSVEELMQATMQVRRTFFLSEAEHRLCCEEGIRRGERLLSADLFYMETRRN
jgi:hypothetical protein